MPRQDEDRKSAKNPHYRQKAHEIMFQKSQTTSEKHIDDDKEHRKYVPAMTNRAGAWDNTESTLAMAAPKKRVGNDKNAQ
ncbi:MAG: hypothetical protein V8S77_08705 [Oscillospiraceae bacterium]